MVVTQKQFVTKVFQPLDLNYFSEPYGAKVTIGDDGLLDYDRTHAGRVYNKDGVCVSVRIAAQPGELIAFWRYNKITSFRFTQVYYVQSNGFLRYVPKESPLATREGLAAENAHWGIQP